VNFGPQTKKVLLARIEPPKWIFWGDYIFQPLGVLRPKIYTRPRDCLSLDSAHPKWNGDPPKILIVKI